MPPMPDELPPDVFLASLPWWVVLAREPSPAGTAAASDPPAAAPGYLVLDTGGVTCLAVFTDEDLAERFVRTAGFGGGPLPVHTPPQFAALARRLPPICTCCAFDPPPRVGGRARWVVSLAQVLKALKEAQAEAEGR